MAASVNWFMFVTVNQSASAQSRPEYTATNYKCFNPVLLETDNVLLLHQSKSCTRHKVDEDVIRNRESWIIYMNR